MELKRRLDPRVVFVALYVLAFAVYIIIGLRPAEAANYSVSANLNIPAIRLDTDVTALELGPDGLETPDTIVGSYSRAENKTLLIGHSTTIFATLNQVQLGEIVNYNNTNYRVVAIDMVPKSDISMNKVLARADEDTIIMMTCAGQLLDGGDATHRLMVTAIRD